MNANGVGTCRDRRVGERRGEDVCAGGRANPRAVDENRCVGHARERQRSARAAVRGLRVRSVVVVVVVDRLWRVGLARRDDETRLEIRNVVVRHPRSSERPKEQRCAKREEAVRHAVRDEACILQVSERTGDERRRAERENEERGAVRHDDELRAAQRGADERGASRVRSLHEKQHGDDRQRSRCERSERIEREREHEIELTDSRRETEVVHDHTRLARPSRRGDELGERSDCTDRAHERGAPSPRDADERPKREDERKDTRRGSRERAEDLEHQKVSTVPVIALVLQARTT